MQTSSKGGSRLTEVKLLAVRPTGLPPSSRQVTTVTPVAKQPKRVAQGARIAAGAIFGLASAAMLGL